MGRGEAGDKRHPWQTLALLLLIGLLLSYVPGARAQTVKDAVTPESTLDEPDPSRPQVEDQVASGLIDENSYRSPQFGAEVSWTGSWRADPSSMESDTDRVLDRLSIVNDSARFQAFFVGAAGESAEQYMQRFMEFRLADDATIEIAGAGSSGGIQWVAYTTAGEGDRAHDLVEIGLADDGETLQVVEVVAWSGKFDQAFDDAMSDIRVNGSPPFAEVEGWPGRSCAGPAKITEVVGYCHISQETPLFIEQERTAGAARTRRGD